MAAQWARVGMLQRRGTSCGRMHAIGPLHSQAATGGGMPSGSSCVLPWVWRVHRVPDAHRCYLLGGWVRGVGLGLGVVHGTLGGHSLSLCFTEQGRLLGKMRLRSE